MTRSVRAIVLGTAVCVLAGCEQRPASPLAPSTPDAEGGAAVPPAVAAAVTQSQGGSPSQQFEVPEESPGPPFYAISNNGAFVPNDGVWAAIAFLRRLDCVPPTASLLTVIGPSAFGCALTVEGHEHWQHGPGLDPAPRQTLFTGLGDVPIVFVRWSEIEQAMAGGLTLPELLALPSARVGTADYYKETDVLGISGPHGAGRGSYTIEARGTVGADPFRLNVNEVLGELRVVQIEFDH